MAKVNLSLELDLGASLLIVFLGLVILAILVALRYA